MTMIYILVPDYGLEGYGKPESAHVSLEAANGAKSAASTAMEVVEIAMEQGEWRDIATAPAGYEERNKPAWLFTPGERLGPNEKDDVRLARPGDWGWATMWMPAVIPSPPNRGKQEKGDES